MESSLFGTIYTYLFSETNEENQQNVQVPHHRRNHSVDRVNIRQQVLFTQNQISKLFAGKISSVRTTLFHNSNIL